MKKIIIIFVLVIGVLSGCVAKIKPDGIENLRTEIKILVIDSCEYLQYPVNLAYSMTNGIPIEYKAYFLEHKGNCKYCIERNKHNK